MPVIDDIREQNQKVKGKGFKYAFQYFLDYYKYPTIAILVGIAALIWIIVSISTAKKTAFDAIFINSANTPDPVLAGRYLEIDEAKTEVCLDTSYFITTETEAHADTTYASAQKLAAVIAAKEADVILTSPDVFNKYLPSGIYGDLRNFLSEETLAALGDKVIWGTVEDEDQSLYLPVAIDVTDYPQIAGNYCFPAKTVYFMFVTNTQRSEKAVKFFEYLSTPVTEIYVPK